MLEFGNVKIPNSIMERRGCVALEEFCSQQGHEKINLMLLNNEVICPRCRAERNNETFSKVQTEKQLSFTKEGRRTFLYRNSIVHDKSILEKGLKDFIPKTDKEKEILKIAGDVAREIAGNTVRNVFIYGNAGAGKTHTAIGMLRNINELSTSKRCLAVSVTKLLELIKKSYQYPNDPINESYYLDLLSQADILLLDDIGSDISLGSQNRSSDFTLRIIYSILNARENKTTLFTSNLTLNELHTIFDSRIVSRISSNLITMNFSDISDKRIDSYKLKRKE